MAGSKALSTEILALFETVRQQAQAYAEAFTHVEELLQNLQQHRERFQQETDRFREQAAAFLEHLRREFDTLIAPLLQRTATFHELHARLARIEADSARLQQLPEQFAGQVAEAIVQVETLVRGTEQKVALVLRSLQEELRQWEQRVEAIRLLLRRDIGELQRQLEELRTTVNPEQLRRQLLQNLEPRFQTLEAQLTELATVLLQWTQEEPAPQPVEPPSQPPVAGEELVLLRQRLTALERRMKALRIVFALLTAGVLAALLLGILHG
ncbi:Chromosome partition protein Smc [bacterium HR21]|nr:Chromosome partition protein Smc [bacterium HR21]